MTVLLVLGLKCPGCTNHNNDHSDPGTQDWYINASDMHWPLLQSPYSLKNRYHSEENT